MAARQFVQRRKVVGLRLIALALVVVFGALAAFLVPLAVVGGLVWLAFKVGLPLEISLLAAIPAYIAVAFAIAYVLARALEESAELRASWGRIAVGAEGIRWDGWVRRTRTPWRDVRDARVEGDAVVVLTHAGARIVLATRDAVALRDTIRAARATHASSQRAQIPDVLSSEDDTTRWIARARTLVTRDAYRAQWTPPRVLARVLEDPEAPAAARVGAAAGLLPCDPEQRERIARVRDESVDDDFVLVLDDLLAERIVPARWARLARRSYTA